MGFSDNLIGTISEVVENPFGIMLTEICQTGENTANVEKMFIPMSEIIKMDIFKKEAK